VNGVEFHVRNRTLLIIALVIVGAVLAFIATVYLKDNPSVQHHVSTGKVGTNKDGTIWIAEYIKERKVFNYTLPYSSVHSKFIANENMFIVAVPDYEQNFRLIEDDEEDPPYLLYIPEFDTSVSFDNLVNVYEDRGQKTEINSVLGLFIIAFRDVRVRALIIDEEFSINGIVTQVHKDNSVTNNGFIIKVNNQHYLVYIEKTYKIVSEFKEINFDIK